MVRKMVRKPIAGNGVTDQQNREELVKARRALEIAQLQAAQKPRF